MPPPGLGLGLKIKVASKLFDPRECGSLGIGERCVLQRKKPDELYTSYIYSIFKSGEAEPIRIRKLVSNLDSEIQPANRVKFNGIEREADVYEALKRMEGFKDVCFPYESYYDEDDIRFIDYGYVPGENAQDYIFKGRFSLEKKKELLRQCIKGLLFLAKHGYVHGDMKLDNFWWDSKANHIRIFDFELARKDAPLGKNQRNKYHLITIQYELNKFYELLRGDHEFNFSDADILEIFGGNPKDIRDEILAADTSKEAMKRLVDMYETILKRLGGAKHGGARRSTRRKSRCFN